MDAIKEVLKQLGKNAEKSPGWVPLIILSYLLISLYGTPDKVFGWRLLPRTLPPEVWATILTLGAYELGDALDKAAFKKKVPGGRTDRFKPGWLERARKQAREALGITEGIYQTSMALVHQAHEALLSVDVLNELAKFLRSLFLPLLGLAVWASLTTQLKLSIILFVCCLPLLPGYILLKLLHMKNLYHRTVQISRRPELSYYDLPQTRMFFWNGVLVSTARLP